MNINTLPHNRWVEQEKQSRVIHLLMNLFVLFAFNDFNYHLGAYLAVTRLPKDKIKKLEKKIICVLETFEYNAPK